MSSAVSTVVAWAERWADLMVVLRAAYLVAQKVGNLADWKAVQRAAVSAVLKAVQKVALSVGNLVVKKDESRAGQLVVCLAEMLAVSTVA